MKLNTKLLLAQKQTLSQSQIQFLEILAMDNVELATFLQKEYLENPIIEWHSGEESNYETDHYLDETAAAETDLIMDFILGQLDLTKYSPVEQQILIYLTNCLEDSGLFTMSSEEVAALLHADLKTVQRCLDNLQQLEPYGIFAPDLPHCLLRQLKMQGIKDPMLEKIILHHLSDVGNGNISTISRTLNLTTLQVKRYISIIKSLNPKPLTGFSSENITYLVPDLIFQKSAGHWEVHINDHWIGDYCLSGYYLGLMNTTQDTELLEFFKAKAQRAAFLMKCIEQRRSTMLKLGNVLMEYQQAFFEGKGPLKSMTLADIAERMEVHASTISRCIKGKYAQYPKSTLLLKSLFSASESDSAKSLLMDLISKENVQNPYSDRTLAKLLEGKNILLSRRVIAKYRDDLGIKSSFERKFHV